MGGDISKHSTFILGVLLTHTLIFTFEETLSHKVAELIFFPFSTILTFSKTIDNFIVRASWDIT